MNKIDLAFTPALEQAQLIKNGEISPLELVEVYLERIQNLNPQLGSYFTVTAEEALADAKGKTEQLAVSKENLPPFFGVTISIKDLTSVVGVRCTYGTPVLMNQIASYDDGIVSKIKAAGFTILGKTATSELGSLPYTEPLGFPPARNPWNLEYTPGGSSGGAAASVAAGLSSIAQGSDGGGSIRGPAFCCGVVGIKPSRGRISFAPVGDRLSGISVNGPIAHTVADAAALLDVMSGYITGDPYWLQDPNPSFLVATKQNLGSLNIAFSNTLLPVGEADPICQKSVLETVKILAEMGHKVNEISLDLNDLIEPFRLVWQSGVVAAGIPSAALDKVNQWLAEHSCNAGEYLQAVAQMQIIARRIVALFDNFDVLVLPVFMHPTIRVGEWAELPPEAALAKVINWVAPCPPFNASGQPSIAIPMGFNSATGLPLGVQLVGRPAAEATLISLATQIEAAKPWIQHRPTLAT
ncbi:amidase [Floridanema evergladense]|uniref:Amidase n=1 Tax=Floridaenema evergladense BLCC-F167 TaxID=3153639 RepID=A0ABV4WSP8_9CYAN